MEHHSDYSPTAQVLPPPLRNSPLAWEDGLSARFFRRFRLRLLHFLTPTLHTIDGPGGTSRKCFLNAKAETDPVEL